MILLNKPTSAKTANPIRWVANQTKKFLPGIIVISLIDIVLSLIMIYLAYVSKGVIDSGAKGNTNKFIFYSVVIFSVILCQLLLNALSSMLTVQISGKYINSMREYMFSSVMAKKYSKLFGHHSGDILNRFTSDIDTVASGAINIIPSITSMITKIVVGTAALIFENWIFAVAVLLIGFIVPLCGRLVSKKYKSVHKEVQKSEGKTRSFIQEGFANIVVIKTFISEAPIIDTLKKYMNENLKLKLKRNVYSIIVHTLLNAFFTIGYYIILVWGSSMLVTGVFTFGTLNYYLQLVSILRAPLQNISGILPSYYSMTASAERLMEIEDMEDEPTIIDQAQLNEIKSSFEKISVDNLAFAYENELVLKNCSFDINRGKITAITGESGSGKSTLFKLILGLYEPTGGSITFNGKTKVDASTRGMFSYVPQSNMMLSGTIRENITLGNPNITDEQIISAAKSAVIYDFIESLPNGFETVLTERGGGLSEGQLQRISIARALILDAPILLLDESTSALDEETETELLSNIKNISGKTILFITHRHTSLGVCDTVVHVKDKKYSVIK